MSKGRKYRKSAQKRFEEKKSTPVASGKQDKVNDAEEQYNLGMKYINDKEVWDYTRAVSCFKIAAEQGHTQAQFQLGECYRLGKGVEKDIPMALSLFEKAAMQGHAQAQNTYGMYYILGRGVEKDYERGIHWVEKSAVQGFAEAQNNLGYFYKNGVGVEKDYEKAIYWYEMSAQQGFASAQLGLGNSYYDGIGVKSSSEKALYWYKQAAKQDLALAQSALGKYYRYSEHNYPEAVFWYKKAAEQGVASSMFELGMCYYEGRGVEKDYEMAAYWLEKAVKAGSWGARSRLEEVERLLEKSFELKDPEKLYIRGRKYFFGDSVERNLEKAFRLYYKAAGKGHLPSQCALAKCYQFGHGIKKDETEAFIWFEAAAVKGYAEAQYELGVCYDYGLSVQSDKDKALKWYEKAAKQGDDRAMLSLALKYHYSSEDGAAEKAVYWLEKSVANGNDTAMYLLATRYLEGNGVKNDKDKGLALMRKAAEAGNDKARAYFVFDEDFQSKTRMLIPRNVIRKGDDGEYEIDIKDEVGVYQKVYYRIGFKEKAGRIKGCYTLFEFGNNHTAGSESDDVWESGNITVIFAGLYDNPLCSKDEIHALFVVKNDNSFGVKIKVSGDARVDKVTVSVLQNLYRIGPGEMSMVDLDISSYTADHLDPEEVAMLEIPFELTNEKNGRSFYMNVSLKL